MEGINWESLDPGWSWQGTWNGELPPENDALPSGPIFTSEFHQNNNFNAFSSQSEWEFPNRFDIGRQGVDLSSELQSSTGRNFSKSTQLTTEWIDPSSESPGPLISPSHSASPLASNGSNQHTAFNTPGLTYSKPETPQAIGFDDLSSFKEDDQHQITCSNCGTQTTPLWRRDIDGLPICNACGLFVKLHGIPRPRSLRTDGIKKRKRSSCMDIGTDRTRTRSSRNKARERLSFQSGESYHSLQQGSGPNGVEFG